MQLNTMYLEYVYEYVYEYAYEYVYEYVYMYTCKLYKLIKSGLINLYNLYV